MAGRAPAYDLKANKQTVSVTLNADLYRQAKSLGINTSQVAEEALAAEVSRRLAERVRAEIQADLEAANAYAARHGSFAEMVRDHYGSGDD